MVKRSVVHKAWRKAHSTWQHAGQHGERALEHGAWGMVQCSMVHRAQGMVYKAHCTGHGTRGMEHRAWSTGHWACFTGHGVCAGCHKPCFTWHVACCMGAWCTGHYHPSSLSLKSQMLSLILPPLQCLWYQRHTPPLLHCLWNQRHQVSLFSETLLRFHRRVSDFRGILILNFRKLLITLLTQKMWN